MKYPERINDLTEKQRWRLIASLPKAALVQVVQSVCSSLMLGGALWHDLLMASAAHDLHELFVVEAQMSKLRPRMKRVKNARQNQPLIRQWNRLVARQAGSLLRYTAVAECPLVKAAIRQAMASLRHGGKAAGGVTTKGAEETKREKAEN